jgi:predicted O-methyltransferase YrrM
VRRITTVFEERFVQQMEAVYTKAELEEIEYDLALTPYPAQQDDGSVGLNMGISVSLSARTIVLTDRVLVTGLVEDPYADDAKLALNVRELMTGLRAKQAEAAKISNGGLIIPGGRAD